MDIVINYPTQVEEWRLENETKFFGNNIESLEYAFAISPKDPIEPDCIYITIDVEKKIENSNYGIVFLGKTSNCFKVRNNNIAPTIEFCFDLFDNATFEFAKVFNTRKVGTFIFDKKVPIPQIEDYRSDIGNIINFWNNNLKSSSIN